MCVECGLNYRMLVSNRKQKHKTTNFSSLTHVDNKIYLAFTAQIIVSTSASFPKDWVISFTFLFPEHKVGYDI